MSARVAARILVVLAAVAAFGAAGCGGKRAAAKSAIAAAVGEMVHVEGTLQLRGSQPTANLVIETADGAVASIDSKTLQGELRELVGMRVRVEGEALPRLVKQIPRIDVSRYEILRLPSGELPVVGVVTLDGDRPVLTTSQGTRYWIRGDLVGVIRDYAGAKIWIVGTLGDVSLPNKPQGSTPYWVTGYGVLVDATSPSH